MAQKNGMIKVWGLFALFILLFILNFFVSINDSQTKTQMAWQIIKVCVFALSVVMLMKYKLPEKKQIIISIVFGLLMFVPYVSMAGIKAFLAIDVPAVTFLSSMAFFSISKKYPENAIPLLKSNSCKSIFISIFVGIAVGIVWGIGNLFLNSNEPNPNISIINFIVPLNPGIYEEIAFRAFIFAACLHFMKGEMVTKAQRFTYWFMMIIPHVLVHTPDIFIENGIVGGMMTTIILTALFGLPFAFLQRKRDLTSAMIAHGVVMIIFFNVYGIST